jgi:hypothetical protein
LASCARASRSSVLVPLGPLHIPIRSISGHGCDKRGLRTSASQCWCEGDGFSAQDALTQLPAP